MSDKNFQLGSIDLEYRESEVDKKIPNIDQAVHSSNNKNVVAVKNEVSFEKKSESQDQSIGKLYEFELFVFLLTKGHDISFDLGKEVKIGHKFDDVAIRYEDTNTSTKKYIFIQAKHVDKSESKKITKDVLLGRSKISMHQEDFNLKKYFVSYLLINDQFTMEKSKKLEKLVIFTNVFDLDIKDKHIIITKINTSKSNDDIKTIFHIRENCNSYKLNVGKESILFKELKETEPDLNVLLNQLTKLVKGDNQKNKFVMSRDNDCINYYHAALMKEILEVKDEKKVKIVVFKKAFIDGKDLSTRAFNLKEKLIVNIKSEIKGGVSDSELKAKLNKARCKASKNFDEVNIEGDIVLPDYTVEDSDIDNFFDYLELSLNQPSLNQLATYIKEQEISEQFLKYIPSKVFKDRV